MKTATLHKKIILFSSALLLLSLSFAAFAHEINKSFAIHKPLAILENETAQGSSPVTFLQDNAGQQFVLKNNNDPQAAIIDAVGSHVGASVGIPINKVKIIPKKKTFPGKKENCIATLHTRVPGKEVARCNDLKINLFGGLSDHSHLISMSKNASLQKILALDLFFNNFDRHNGNLFYDETTGQFYAIDMDFIFPRNRILPEKNLPELFDWLKNDFRNLDITKNAQLFLQKIKNNKIEIEEYHALQHVQTTLEKLVKAYPPSKLYTIWMDYTQKAKYNYSILRKVYIRGLLSINYYRVKKFLKELDTFLTSIENKLKSQSPSSVFAIG